MRRLPLRTLLATLARREGEPTSACDCRTFAAETVRVSTGQPAEDTTGDKFRYADLEVHRTRNPQRKPQLEGLLFGQHFTDHMFQVEHVYGGGWGCPTIHPFAPFQMHPASSGIHIGLSCFEGMKAYMGVDGRGRLFRPDMNMARFHRSSRRLHLADFDQMEFLECLKELLRVDKSWLPAKEGYSLYVRPFMFSSSHNLGIAPPSRTTMSVIVSPCGPYFPTGMRPVRLFVDEHMVRAWPGGAGDVKIAGNYSPTIEPLVAAARDYGASQSLFVLPQGPDRDQAVLSEAGGMNFFAYIDKGGGQGQELVTPPLDGTVLPGITRDSILQLARSWGEFQVSERYMTLLELDQAAKAGRIRELFMCGTAAVVQPVHELARAQRDMVTVAFDPKDVTTLTARFTRALADIQYGHVPHEWSVPFE
ncbi:hypothetical protein WJX73_005014 [Symbiochloris irregularis]|uniref:Branched-chain-amino-acid aminotransferase n=1 Tax=Symbiochloris irregularis TaxID=706552 RepID=A0AAW1NS15_9CHLO